MAKRPLGVSVISILIIISAIIIMLLGSLLLILGILTSPIGLLLVLFGLFIIALGIIQIVVSFSLRKGKNWARILIIILGSIGIISGIIGIIISISNGSDILTSISSGIFGMILPLIYVPYLLFSKNVKRFFT